MNERQIAALLWATRAIHLSDFNQDEQGQLASAARKLEAGQAGTLTPSEHRTLGDAALCAGTLLTASFAGINSGALPQPAPNMADLDAAQAYCDEHGRREVALA